MLDKGLDSELEGEVIGMRPGSQIEGMFYDVASTEEVAQLERLYDKRNWGAAETFALRRIVPKWIELHNAPHYA